VVIAPEVTGHASVEVEAAAAAPAGALFPDGASQRSTLVRPSQPASLHSVATSIRFRLIHSRLAPPDWPPSMALMLKARGSCVSAI